MPDILLIQPPIEDFYLTAKRTVPYGLACIAAALRQKGFSVDILDGLATAKARVIPWPGTMAYLQAYYGRQDRSPFGLFHHFRHFGYSYTHLAKQAQESGAFLIGISSLFTAYSDAAMKTAAAVRKACPQATIVLGGHHPTALPDAVLQHSAVDYVLRGDGEMGLPLLAAALRDGTPIEKIPGLAFRQPDGHTRHRPPAVVPDLDRMPVPAFDLIDWRFYQRNGRGSVSLTASRGCPLRCTYCAVNAGSHHGFRKRSVESVIAELTAAFACRTMGMIDFEDEHLCADKAWFMDLMEAMHRQFKHQQPELRAMNGIFTPSLDPQMLTCMRQAGFKTLNLALITTSKTQLKRFGRPDLTADVDRVLTLAQQVKLNTVAYLIVAGPDQDPHASVADLLFLAQRPLLVGISVFYPAPGSDDYQWCANKGVLPSDFGLMRATALPLSQVTDRTQAVTLMRLGRILNFMKALVDQGQALPAPAPVPISIDAKVDRADLGKILLAVFLKEGRIYGMDTNGEIYPHQIDTTLTQTFLGGLRRSEFLGTQISSTQRI